MRFFWQRNRPRRAVEQVESPPRRQHYRARPSERQSVCCALHLPSGERRAAELVDVSGNGMALRLSLDLDPVLARGDVVELELGMPDRPVVRTPGEVVFSEQDGECHTRYGFRFVNLGNLYAQLDDQYARLFNRRGTQRAAAALDQRIPVRLSWTGSWLDTGIHDISEGGVGVFLDREQAILLRRIERVRASFELRAGETVEGHLDVVHRTELRASPGELVGLRFDFGEADGFGRHERAIKAFVAERNRRIAGWEGSWRSAG